MPLRKRIRSLIAGLAVTCVAAALIGVGVQEAAAATTQTCTYATPDTGNKASTLCWFDMSNFSPAAAAGGGQQMQLALPGGYTVSYTIESTTTTMSTSTLPSFPYAPLGVSMYTGIAGRPALMTSTSAVVTLSGIGVTGPDGNPLADFSFVAADAESSNGGESIVFTASSPWSLLDPIGTGCGGGFSGVGTTTVTCIGSSVTPTGTPVLAARNPSTVQTELTPLGRQGVAFGILIPRVEFNKVVASRFLPSDSFTLQASTAGGSVLGTATTGELSSTASTGPLPALGDGVSTAITLSESSAATPAQNYTQSWSCTRNGAPDPTLPSGAAGTSVSVDPGIGDLISCTVTNTAIPGSLSLQKIGGAVTDVNGNGLRDAGDTIPYSFQVRNTGQVTLENLAVQDPALPGVTCAQTTLAPGATTTCTGNAPHTFTLAEQNAGSSTNSATATASPVGIPAAVFTSNTSAVTTTLTAPAPALGLTKTVAPATASAAGDTVAYTYTVTNTGNVNVSGIAIDESGFTGTGTAPAPVCQVTALAPTTSTTCTASYTVTQADVDAGGFGNTAAAKADAFGTAVSSAPASAAVTIAAAPAITLAKSVAPNDAASYVVGQQLVYTFVATNSGNVTLTGVGVAEVAFTGSGGALTITCPPSAAVPPGGQVDCTAPYTLTQADIDGGELTNTATASGTPPTGAPVVSAPSTVTTPANQAPAIGVTVSADRPSVSRAGDTIGYSITVTNTGTPVLVAVKV